MQRLNAVFAFLENEYPVEGTYFNLDTLADTKLLKDQGKLVQQQPVMSRERSNAVANYTVAMSVYRSDDDASVDEVFRRINAGGRRLLRQGLRQAGTLSSLADLVRIISARIRGDTSPGNILPLGVMPKLSITNNNLPYGVNVDEIFWVSQGVLRRDDVRESADEQLVLDLLLDMLVDPLENSGMRTRDAYYDYTEGEPAPGPSPQSVLIERHRGLRRRHAAGTLHEDVRRDSGRARDTGQATAASPGRRDLGPLAQVLPRPLHRHL